MQPGHTYQHIEPTSPHLLPEPDMKPIQSLADVEQEAIINALRVTNYKITKAAKQLGVSRTTLYAKIDKYNISLPS